MSEKKKNKAEMKLTWPEESIWPQPYLHPGFGIWTEEEVQELEVDEETRELLKIKEYFDRLVEEGKLDEDYRLADEGFWDEEADLDEEWIPEMGEEYWREDRFDEELWLYVLAEKMDCLKLTEHGHSIVLENGETKWEYVNPVWDIADIIGYTFINENLLRQAFTRRAFQIEHHLSGCSEELEFIGDAFLSMEITREMMKCYTHMDERRTEAPFSSCLQEGELSKIRQHFSNQEYLAGRCRELGLDRYILYGASEAETESALEDALEALIGAVAVDCGQDPEVISEVIDRLLHLQLESPHKLLKKSFYEILNTWHQKKFGVLPEYKLYAGKEGYTCILRYRVPENDKGLPYEVIEEYTAKTRSKAREITAEFAYRYLNGQGLWRRLTDAGIEPDFENSINQLQELYQKKYILKPEYTFTEEASGWFCECFCGDFGGQGRASAKVKAKKKASYEALVRLFKGAGISKAEWEEEVFRQMCM